MASLRSQLPDLEAVEPISPVMTPFFKILVISMGHMFLYKVPCFDFRFLRTSFNHSYRPFSQTSPSTNNKNIWRTKRTINLEPRDPAMKTEKNGEEKLTSSFESRIEKQGKDKSWPKPALRGSTRRMTKVEPRGISFNIFATWNNIVQNMPNMQQFRSEYAEYATISFRICNNIVQNMQNMRQDGSEWFKLWICPELSVSSKLFHPFCPDPLFQCSFSL